MTEEEEVLNRSLYLAKKYHSDGMFGRSFAHLLIVLKLRPQLGKTLENLFISVLSSWDKQLESEGRYSDLFTCYEQALELYKHHLLYHRLGLHLYRLHYRKEAIQYFQLALRSNKEYLPSIKNMYNLFNECVERWHFKMLNDDNRNTSYRNAISRAIQKGHTSILDIGTGTGLLSVYAKLAGGNKVYACDYSDVMVDIAHQVISKNLEPTSVTVINKLSNDIIIPQDIPSRCSLVVTETVDAALFGERILQTLIHAWENLLVPLKTDDIVNATVIPQSANVYVTPVQCQKIARMNQILERERLEENFIKLDKIKLFSKLSGPYDTENLKRVEHCCLSEPVQVFNINFNDLLELNSFVKGFKNIENFPVKCNKKGFIDALAVWFDLHLDASTVISSSPKCDDHKRCWDQAVFPLNHKVYVDETSSINIDVGCTNGELDVKLSNNYLKTTENLIDVPQESIRYLNCISLHRIFQHVISNLKNNQSSIKINKVLDISPFPVMGVFFAQHFGANITCVTEISAENLAHILHENNIPRQKFKNLDWDEFSTTENMSDFDVLIIECFQGTGQFNENVINNLQKVSRCLRPDGIILPSSIHVCCQLVSSDQLYNESLVTNLMLKSEIQLADYINSYKVPYHIDLNIDEIIYECLSERFTIGQLNVEDLSKEGNIVFECEIDISEEGYLNAILYWYDYDMHGYMFSTCEKDSPINQSAWIIEPCIKVSKRDVIKIRALYNQSFLYFIVKKM